MNVQPEYGIVELNSSNYDEVLSFLVKHFVTRDPLTQGLHVTEPEKLTFMTSIVQGFLDSGVSVGAKDLQNGQLIGILLSKILTRLDPKPFESDLNDGSPLHQCYQILDILDESTNLFEDPDVGKVLELGALTVQQCYAGKGIGRWLVQEGENRGRRLGCNMAVAQLTNVVSQRIFDQLNFTTRFTLDLTKRGKEDKPQLDLLAMNGTTKFTCVTKQFI